jgi:hypothetical protein
MGLTHTSSSPWSRACCKSGFQRLPVGSQASTIRFEAGVARHPLRPRQGRDHLPDAAADHPPIEHAGVVVADHHRLLVIGEVDADDRGIQRHQLPQRRQARIPTLHTDRHELRPTSHDDLPIRESTRETTMNRPSTRTQPLPTGSY